MCLLEDVLVEVLLVGKIQDGENVYVDLDENCEVKVIFIGNFEK